MSKKYIIGEVKTVGVDGVPPEDGASVQLLWERDGKIYSTPVYVKGGKWWDRHHAPDEIKPDDQYVVAFHDATNGEQMRPDVVINHPWSALTADSEVVYGES